MCAYSYLFDVAANFQQSKEILTDNFIYSTSKSKLPLLNLADKLRASVTYFQILLLSDGYFQAKNTYSTINVGFYSYDVGSWSKCSQACGLGRRSRRVVCKQEYTSGFVSVVPHRKCKGNKKPRAHERCVTQRCAKWEYQGVWSKVDHIRNN